MDENEWRYHGEGNKSLVVSHRQVMALRGAPRAARRSLRAWSRVALRPPASPWLRLCSGRRPHRYASGPGGESPVSPGRSRSFLGSPAPPPPPYQRKHPSDLPSAFPLLVAPPPRTWLVGSRRWISCRGPVLTSFERGFCLFPRSCKVQFGWF